MAAYRYRSPGHTEAVKLFWLPIGIQMRSSIGKIARSAAHPMYWAGAESHSPWFQRLPMNAPLGTYHLIEVAVHSPRGEADGTRPRFNWAAYRISKGLPARE